MVEVYVDLQYKILEFLDSNDHTEKHVEDYRAACDLVFSEIANLIKSDKIADALITPHAKRGFARLTS